MKAAERHFSRRIDLTSLQLFVAVCELGSIGRAAEKEFIAASAISKRLSDLEASLQTPLLYRHTKGVDLTPAGESLLHHARAVLNSLERMQGDLSEYAQGVRGHVRIHASMSAIVQFLPEDLGHFVATHPEVKIELQEHLSYNVVRAVRDGEADLGICNQSVGTAGLQTLPYRHDKLVLVVPQNHPLRKHQSIAFADSLPYDQVGLQQGSSIDLAMQGAATAAGHALRLRIRVAGLDAMCRMIHNRLGVGLMPQQAFKLMGASMDLHAIALTDAWAQREIVLLARDFAALPVTTRLLVSLLAPTLPKAGSSPAA